MSSGSDALTPVTASSEQPAPEASGEKASSSSGASSSQSASNEASSSSSSQKDLDPLKPNLLGSLISCPTLKSGLPGQDNGIVIQIQNITATVDMGVRLNLVNIASKCHNTEYNPKKFGACVMRLREPKTTMLLFSSGRVSLLWSRDAFFFSVLVISSVSVPAFLALADISCRCALLCLCPANPQLN